MIVCYSLECLTSCMDSNVNVLLAGGLYLGNGLLGGWVDGGKGLARLALVPLVVNEELQQVRKNKTEN